MVDKFTVGAGFHKTLFPQVRTMAVFHPYTAIGKLNAVITPTNPTGFQFSINACPGPSTKSFYNKKSTFLVTAKEQTQRRRR